MNKHTANMLLDSMDLADEYEGGATLGDTTVMVLQPRSISTTPEKVRVVEVVKEGPTKKDLAREVWAEMAGMKRALVINAMMARAGLSKAGASTYYQNFKGGKWT